MMIKMKKENDHVFFVEDLVTRIGAEEVGFLKKKVLQTQRKTIRLCMHKNVEDAVQEMLILHSKETYIRPHKHIHKSVSYHIIEGEADMILFDEEGSIIDMIPL